MSSAEMPSLPGRFVRRQGSQVKEKKKDLFRIQIENISMTYLLESDIL